MTKLEQVLGHQRICGKNFLPSGFFLSYPKIVFSMHKVQIVTKLVI